MIVTGNQARLLAVLAFGMTTFQSSLTVAAPCLYIADLDRVVAIDASTNAPVASIPMFDCREPDAIALTNDGSQLLLGTYQRLSVVDVATNLIVARSARLSDYVEHIAPSPDGRHAYVTLRWNTSQLINITNIAVIDLDTLEVVRTIEHASEAAFSPDGRWIYAFDEPYSPRKGGIKVIDATNGEVETMLPGIPGRDLVLAPDGQFLYVYGGNGPVTVIDAVQKVVVATIPEYGIEAIVFGPTSDVAYVVKQPQQAMWIMKVPEGEVIAEVPLDDYGRRIAITADGASAYVVQSEIDPSKRAPISTIDLATNAVTETVRGPIWLGNQIAIGSASRECGPEFCEGDCNTDGAVTVDELLEGIRMILARPGAPVPCACRAFERDEQGMVNVDSLTRGVSHALGGCSTLTPPPTPSPIVPPPSFETCRTAMARNREDCVRSGGQWTRNSTFTEICACPTGEGDVPCTSHAQCLAGCFALNEVSDNCADVSFLCASQVPLVGCFCTAGETGVICD